MNSNLKRLKTSGIATVFVAIWFAVGELRAAIEASRRAET